MKRIIIFLVIMITTINFSCKKKIETEDQSAFNKPLFSLVLEDESGVKFSNIVRETNFNNLITNFYVYNGAGVALGDINNDGLDDIYLVSNQGKDQLYLNEGDLKFKNITQSAQIKNNTGWSTGVNMIDINNDGWLDVFVCQSSPVKSKIELRNKVYINQKNETFKESAVLLGLDHLGFSVQTYFLDFDQDGDLDIYVLDHQMRNVVFKENTSIEVKNQYKALSNQLYRNDGNTFTNITSTAFSGLQIYPSLSASIGDFNNDNWPDIYVCNDFLLPDQLLINQKDGTFSDEILARTSHTSSNSMGSDYADINNDALPDLVVLDMLAEDHIRSKENMTSMNTKLFDSLFQIGYQKQYMSNVLQLNRGDGSFSEIGQLAGINKTDWSWGPLIADFDNDGLKDIFISNGIEKDIDNRDFRSKYQEYLINKTKLSLEEFHNLVPSNKLSNYIFKNSGGLKFINKSDEWGLSHKVNSNGAAYSDLDNDGDLDIVLNNINDVASIYENNSAKNYVKINLSGSKNNPFAFGAKVYVYSGQKTQYQEVYSARGYQSSSSLVMNFGLDNASTVDSIKIVWDKNRISKAFNIKANQKLNFSFDEGSIYNSYDVFDDVDFFSKENSTFMNLNIEVKANNFDDFSLQLLLPQKQSSKIKIIEKADLNGDGLEDLIIGNSKDSPTTFLFQSALGKFKKTNVKLLENDRHFQTNDIHVFDADNDGDNDVYMANGGFEYVSSNAMLNDLLYINDGHGNFIKSSMTSGLPQTNVSVVKSFDYDKDDDYDLLVLGGVKPGQYPRSDKSYVLKNVEGQFVDVTDQVIPDLNLIKGTINDAEFSDYDNDGDQDLIIVGEWMPITIFKNEKGIFVKQNIEDLEYTNGWWNRVLKVDIDQDGDDDFLLGNFGNNNKFKPTKGKPLHIFAKDFDDNGSFDLALSKVYNGQLVPLRGRDCSSEQNRFILENAPTFKLFANSNVEELYGAENIASALHLKTYNLSTSYLINEGEGNFRLQEFPVEAQFSPTFDFEVLDINQDGYKDIIGVGNYYDTEVETVSYDAGKGYILLSDGKGNYNHANNSGLNFNLDTRSISSLLINENRHIVVGSYGSELSIYKLKK